MGVKIGELEIIVKIIIILLRNKLMFMIKIFKMNYIYFNNKNLVKYLQNNI
jgi:hypothetical protein